MTRSIRVATFISALLLSAGVMAQTGGTGGSGNPTQNMDKHPETQGAMTAADNSTSTAPKKTVHKKRTMKKSTTPNATAPDTAAPHEGSGGK